MLTICSNCAGGERVQVRVNDKIEMSIIVVCKTPMGGLMVGAKHPAMPYLITSMNRNSYDVKWRGEIVALASIRRAKSLAHLPKPAVMARRVDASSAKISGQYM